MAKVLDVVYDQSTGHHSALFHYIGFNHKFDEWIDIRSNIIIKNDLDVKIFILRFFFSR